MIKKMAPDIMKSARISLRRKYRRVSQDVTTCRVTGDVDGSVEAILDTLDSYMSEQCALHILQYGVGTVNEQDVEMAANFGGMFCHSKLTHWLLE